MKGNGGRSENDANEAEIGLPGCQGDAPEKESRPSIRGGEGGGAY